jgi:hypothetical protein
MNNWQKACSKIKANGLKVKSEIASYGVYPSSLQESNGSFFYLVKEGLEKKLVIQGKSSQFESFSGEVREVEGEEVKVCSLTHENCEALREVFPFTAPSSVLKCPKSIGLGDRLGLASPGHIRLIKEYDIKPILAQQSIRELNLTGRNYTEVLDDASWAVFQEGYKGGFGADGDHLKTAEEVKGALACGFTMITLDCSEHIDNNIDKMSNDEVDKAYEDFRQEKVEEKYLGKEFKLGNGITISFDDEELKRIVLTYSKAINFASDIYHQIIKDYNREVDFEISIDETLTPTSPQAHFFVAQELKDSEVKAATVAPRFCGEFQKGIDYIGNVKEFEDEFIVHTAIADYFGYKISVHSGSDKFSVFPIVGERTQGRYHVKTAGTNWLEAIRVIATKDPALYREIHSFALSVLDDAKKYYHIGADTNKIPQIDQLKDEELPGLMDKDDSRQVLHITYGLILQAKKENGDYLFRDRIYDLLNTHEDAYYDALYKHIGRHIEALERSF